MALLPSASTSDRTNILTKTHHDDLDVISSLLQEVWCLNAWYMLILNWIEEGYLSML